MRSQLYSSIAVPVHEYDQLHRLHMTLYHGVSISTMLQHAPLIFHERRPDVLAELSANWHAKVEELRAEGWVRRAGTRIIGLYLESVERQEKLKDLQALHKFSSFSGFLAFATLRFNAFDPHHFRGLMNEIGKEQQEKLRRHRASDKHNGSDRSGEIISFVGDKPVYRK